ncbi:hypothetical protein QFC21_002447 [Naganishia friedmannii]|uniref:Uncharacterized protein n=1 Tax=Naganishia friedmannii TaxID=89922 RepID=A0ACC2VY42_9TREE|nr:hypothetical protein QFC21_002447 [Naganishia friedmannii]
MLASTITLFATLAVAFAAPVVEERQSTWGGYDWTKGIGSSTPTTGSTGGCPAYEVISARGTTESQAAPYGNTATVNGIINAVGGNSARYEVVYAVWNTGSRDITFETADTNFATGPAIGAADLVKHVNNRLSSCPNTKFVLIGYLQGAMVTVTAENNSQLPRNSIVAVILYGNPYWLPGRPENSGTARFGFGDASAFGVKTPLSGDIICTSTGSIYAHLAYSGSTQQAQAIAFATAQLRAAGI